VQIPCKGLIKANVWCKSLDGLTMMASDVCGKAITYDVKSRSFGDFPAHPLEPLQTSSELEQRLGEQELT